MNIKLYKNSLYEVRDVSDLRNLLLTSCELYSDRTAYFIKERPGGKYKPVKYRQVKEDIFRIATGLFELGLKGKKVAIIGENSYGWAITYFAVVCGGGIVVPLDKELPEDEIVNLLKRSGAEALVYSLKMEKIISNIMPELDFLKHIICMKVKHKLDVMDLPKVWELGKNTIASGDKSFEEVIINPEECCALIFTSGTMGLAKGVMLSHRNIAANVKSMSQYVQIGEGDVGLSVLPMHHTYEMTCHIFTGFYQGMAVAFCEGLKYITKNMVEAKATVMLAVPLIFENMHKKIFKQASQKGGLEKMNKAIALSRKLKLYNERTIAKKMFSKIHKSMGNHMRLFIAGGAAIEPKVIQDFEAMGITMIQGYGMTENAPIIAVNKDRYSKAAAAGLVVPDNEVKIIDKDSDGIGEIIVRGPSVMLGYYDNQEATDECIKDGWLYTGDYGYMDEDGFLYVSGRKKNVIVTKNGKNIFPEEVEYYLLQSEYIEEAIVYGVYDEKTGGTTVKAEIFPAYKQIKEDLGNLSEEEIERFIYHVVGDINDKMTSYKRVSKIKIRETEFEKTSTKKIKRNQTNQ